MSWACETTALRAAAPAAGDRALWMDFDNFLANPETEFARAALHLTGSPPPPTIAAVAADPIMGRYSKAPEYAYDTDLRRQVLAQARDLHGVEIAKGLRWLDRAAAQFPPIREAVEFAARR